jgi:eukaryotic-like serine/threonine-protein kinase
MNCSNCGTFLAENMNICPRCGTPTVRYLRDTGSDDPTAPASPARQPLPATSYGPEQRVPPPPQYDANGPYEAPAQYPYPQDPYHSMPPLQSPPGKGRKRPAAFIIGLVLLLVVMGVGSLALFNTHKQPGSQTTKGATPTATPNPLKNPYPPGTGTLVMNDPMQANSKSDDWTVLTEQFNGGVITHGFNNGAYHMTSTARSASFTSTANAPSFSTLSNIAYEAQLTIIQGSSAGIIFRVNHATGYVFSIGVAGTYTFDTFNFGARNNTIYTLLNNGLSTAIKRGKNQTNLIAVVANGSTISAYINHQLVDQLQDTTYKQGKVGIYGYGQTLVDIEAQNVKVWSL